MSVFQLFGRGRLYNGINPRPLPPLLPLFRSRNVAKSVPLPSIPLSLPTMLGTTRMAKRNMMIKAGLVHQRRGCS
eukprot:scaffold10302_cov70-Skeletonema_dohrnii-CCMP3373.AAC.2